MAITRDKGKARAVPNERQPLLQPVVDREEEDTPPITSQRQRWSSILLNVAIALLSLLFALALLAVLVGSSFIPSKSEEQVLSKTAFRYDTSPRSISILNVTEDGVLVNITVNCGINADLAFGIQSFRDEDDRAQAILRGDRGVGSSWWEALRRLTIQTALGILPNHAVEVEIPDSILVLPDHFETAPLFSISLVNPLVIPLVPHVQSANNQKNDWLQPINVLALARPIASIGQLWDFAQKGWGEGRVNVVVGVERARVHVSGINESWMRTFAKYAAMEKEDIIVKINVPVPRLPGLPTPGKPIDLASLVKLEKYSLETVGSALTISAFATFPNIVRGVDTVIPYSLPFLVSLPSGQGDQEMARVVTQPIRIVNGSDRIGLQMSGRVSVIIDPQNNQSSPLSTFLQQFLHGEDSDVIVRGLSTIPAFAPNDTLKPPSWTLSTLPTISLDLIFPGPDPPPKVVRSITVENMKVSEGSGKMRASGTVIALLDLPRNMQTVSVDVKGVLPDILIFDGPVREHDPDDSNGDDGEENYPPGAFGHIKPEDYLDSVTTASDDPFNPYRLVVTAPIQNVPVNILPGRDLVLSAFVRKLVFKGGASAGILGNASVIAELKGIDGQVKLDNLPVKGETWVGRQRVLEN